MGKVNIRKILGMKTAFVGILIVLILFGLNIVKEYNHKRELDKEIRALEAIAKEIEAENLDILNLAQYLDTEEFFEEEARLKLGLQKPGEKAFVVDALGDEPATDQKQKETIEQEKSFFDNIYSWWLYFFGGHTPS